MQTCKILFLIYLSAACVSCSSSASEKPQEESSVEAASETEMTPNRTGWESFESGELHRGDMELRWRSILCPEPESKAAVEQAAREAHEEMRIKTAQDPFDEGDPRKFILRVDVYDESGEPISELPPYMQLYSVGNGREQEIEMRWRIFRDYSKQPLIMERMLIYDFFQRLNSLRDSKRAQGLDDELSQEDAAAVVAQMSVEKKLEVDHITEILQRYSDWTTGAERQ